MPVRSDNYAYLVVDESTKEAAVVDPFDMEAVDAAASREGVKIVANLTTHHHKDHSGGNKVGQVPNTLRFRPLTKLALRIGIRK